MRKTFRSCTYPFGLVEVPRVSMGKKRVETRTGRLWTRTGRFWIVGIFEVGTFPRTTGFSSKSQPAGTQDGNRHSSVDSAKMPMSRRDDLGLREGQRADATSLLP